MRTYLLGKFHFFELMLVNNILNEESAILPKNQFKDKYNSYTDTKH